VQDIAHISKEDKERINDYLNNSNVESTYESTATNFELNIVFYLIKLEIVHDPGRIKVGVLLRQVFS
jgi:hypothetical protein